MRVSKPRQGMCDVLAAKADVQFVILTDSNRQLVVETMRSLAELMIWGDQHDTRFFDFFAEKHLLSFFNRILRQPANRRGEVPQQVSGCVTSARLHAQGCLYSTVHLSWTAVLQ